TARRIRSAIPRSEFERNGLDTGLALAGGYRKWSLSRRKSGNGVAACRFRRIDGTQLARVVRRALAAHRRPSARDAARAAALCVTDRADRMAAPDTARREPPCDCV